MKRICEHCAPDAVIACGECGRDYRPAPNGNDDFVAVPVNAEIRKALDRLRSSGLFGATRADVAERLVCEGLLRRRGPGGVTQLSILQERGAKT